MAEIPQAEIIRQQSKLLLGRWQSEALPLEKFEYPELAVQLMAENLHSPLPLISLICANYETYKINGRRRPTLHREMIWQDRGLRRGYVLCHEEIPYRLSELQITCYRPINHLIVLVDLGMAETLFSDLNPKTAELSGTTIEEDINLTLNSNAQTIQALIDHGLKQKNQPNVNTKVIRLTQIAPPEFYQHWDYWNQLLRESISKLNNPWGGMIRRDLEKDARYYAETWGLETQEALYKRVIDQQYGLTGVIGAWIHQFHNSIYCQGLENKSKLILLDTIPGPDNPAHTEFMAYNLDAPVGYERQKTPILRPLYNLVLLSNPAIQPAYLNKSLDCMIEEANEFC